MRFINRTDAGKQLAEKVSALSLGDVIVFGLPRGGAVIASEIAKALHCPMDLVICKKVAHPHNPEYAIGAVAEEKSIVKDEAESRLVSPDWLAVAISETIWANKRRRKLYFGDQEISNVQDKTVLLADDGIATGLTMMAAIKEMRKRHAKEIIVAIPVSPIDVYWTLKTLADDVICLKIEHSFQDAVGAYYEDFRQVSDEEVIQLLKEK